MKTYLECIPCFFKQALFAARVATEDDRIIKKVLDRVGMLVKDIPLENTPPETGQIVYDTVREVTGVEDPFLEIKQASIDQAAAMVQSLEKKIANSNDRMRTAAKISIAGNIIDFGANASFDLNETVDQVLGSPPAIDDYHLLREKIGRAQRILYLGDNAGETVFDRLFIREIKKRVVYAVRQSPIINDATIEEARQSGLHEVAEVISSGSSAPGTILEKCTDEFVEIFRNADIIISKGQGNFETLSDAKGPVFFLLKVKCPVIARDLGVKEGSIIIKSAQGSRM